MGDQLGSIAYFDGYPADMAVLGELSDNEIFLGHRGRYYFDVTVLGRSAHTCHKPLAVNANALAAHAILELEASQFTPELEDWVRDLFGPETFVVPGRVYGGLPPGGPSMIPDECVIRVDCRPQPGVSPADVRAEVDRCLDRARQRDPRFRAEVVLADVKDGYLAGPDDEVVRHMRDAVRSVRAQSPAAAAGAPARRAAEPALQVAGWLGDTASFGAKVPTVIFGPGGEPVYCPDEHLSVADIIEATQVYASFAVLALARPGA
jgi:acetylornithine deacetylase/succinyl-diaminopimelate desuccinylase-like protein